jgi:polyisoprenoid-binding protein YceI
MMKSPFVLAVAALGISLSVQAADSYTIDSRHTYPVFEVNHLGFSTQRGRFNKSAGKITLDTAAKSGSVELKIETASIDMGLDKWDEHLKSPDFFDAAKHPAITFKSTKLNFDGDKVVGAEGDMTLLGVTKPVNLALSGFRCGEHPMLKKIVCGVDATTTIKRSDFGMKYGLPAIGDEVKLIVPVEAIKD